ncbi:AMP-binding protein [Bradymonas sediminis]|uniref:Uncharacterized protein n=1 Tax=Bradymonas sediminis TaxID=1548548 RepID=A0A2Z4FPI5_9DELT|nr:AMP-binding protein [Bradymonas sediminis]AWV90961.1 hypothetical protein DN745_17160 [Bradymonas sediminis]TDP75302.1 long-subunit acyl-CoA synthetase (AMP-forming) [Bradymonas sediminis]
MHNFPTYFWRKFQDTKDKTALRTVDTKGKVAEETYWEWTRRVQRLAIALLEAGLQPGERIAMTASGGRDWLDLAFASWLIGGCVVVVPTNRPRLQVLRALARTGSSWVVVRDVEQKKFLRGKKEDKFPPGLRWVAFDKPTSAVKSEAVFFLEDLDREGRSLAVRGWVDKLARVIYQVSPEQPSLILFDTDLGEDPHGSHYSGAKVKEILEMLGEDLQLSDTSCLLATLDYGHFPNWLLSAATLLHGGTLATAKTVEEVASNLHTLNPTHLISDARFLERRAMRLRADLETSTAGLQSDGGEGNSGGYFGITKMLGQVGKEAARKLFFDPLSREFGARIEAVYVLGAAPSQELRELLEGSDIQLLGLFARPECGISHLERLSARRPGSRGRPVQSYACKIDGARREGSGEVLVRSHLMFDGYWDDKGPREVDANGWLHTGATGSLQSGYLYIKD